MPSVRPLDGAHNPKVAGSNPAPAISSAQTCGVTSVDPPLETRPQLFQVDASDLQRAGHAPLTRGKHAYQQVADLDAPGLATARRPG